MIYKEYILNDVISKFIDYRGKTPPKTSHGIPLVTAKIVKSGRIAPPNEFIAEDYFDEWMRRGIPRKGDIIITTEAPMGEVAQIKTTDKLAFAQRLIILQSNPELLDENYLLYSLQSRVMQYRLGARMTGTTVTGIKSAELKKVRISLPPLPTQRRIATILSSLDDKIENNRRICEKLEAMAQAIFKQWFVKDVNTEWEDALFGDFVIPQKGKNITKANAVFGKYPVIAGGLEPSCYHNESNTKAPVVTISASGANAGFVNLHLNPVWSSDSSYIDETITDNVYFSYVFLKYYQNIIFDKQEGSAQPHIYPRHLESLETKKFPSDLIEKFENFCIPIFEQVKNLEQQNLNLQKTRDALLPKLMSGEIDVEGTE